MLSGGIPRVSTRFSLSMENGRGLTRDGTVEPVSRDLIVRREREQGNVHFPCSADHEQDWQPYRVIYTLLYVVIIHTYQHAHFMPIVGVGKRGAYFNWSMVICQGSTRSELLRGLLALCRRTLGSERHRYAIA